MPQGAFQGVSRRYQVAMAVARALLAPPLGFFGVLVFFSVFGDGSRLVGALLIAAAVAGPLVHGSIAFGRWTLLPGSFRKARSGLIGLWLLDGVATGVFLVAVVQGGSLILALPFVLVSAAHGYGLVLLHRSRGPGRHEGQAGPPA